MYHEQHGLARIRVLTDVSGERRLVLPFLAERFTCYLVNTRGRGPSGDHPDHTPDRLAEDVVAFAGSIGEPVGLVGSGTPPNS